MNDVELNRREEIVQAALRVFSQHGFHKASIKHIAREAGLKSPSLIYWYFKDKGEVLSAVIAHLLPLIGQVADPQVMMDLPPADVFGMIASAYFTAFDNPDGTRLLRILVSESVHSTESISRIAQNAFPVLNFLTGYLQHQIDLGRLRPHDPRASARAFMGTVIAFIMTGRVIPILGADLPPTAQYQAEIVAIFLEGLRAT
jgi:TetR/AcrR family transcriptional regulator